MKEISLDNSEMQWREAPGYPTGTMMKVLRRQSGIQTCLLRLARGFRMDEHCHTTTEQHYVLQGKYESGGRLYGEGSYRLIPGGVTHGPFSSKDGATLLVVWDPE